MVSHSFYGLSITLHPYVTVKVEETKDETYINTYYAVHGHLRRSFLSLISPIADVLRDMYWDFFFIKREIRFAKDGSS
jgi:hypothetical protein